MRNGCRRRFVFLDQVIDRICVFTIWAVLDKGADRHFCNELRDASDVVRMVMRNEDVVDLLDLCQFGRGNNSICVPIGVVTPSCIDQERLSSRGDK